MPPAPTNLGSKRRTVPHNGHGNAAKRARASAEAKKRRNYVKFLEAMKLVTPYRKKLERNKAFNNTVNNVRGNMNYNNIMFNLMYRRRPLGLTEQQWFALAGAIITHIRHPNINVIPIHQPLAARVRATGRYTPENRNTIIAWAKTI